MKLSWSCCVSKNLLVQAQPKQSNSKDLVIVGHVVIVYSNLHGCVWFCCQNKFKNNYKHTGQNYEFLNWIKVILLRVVFVVGHKPLKSEECVGFKFEQTKIYKLSCNKQHFSEISTKGCIKLY